MSLCEMADTGYYLALTEDWTIYWTAFIGYPPIPFLEWQVWGQIPTGGTTTQPTTWGKIKAEFGE